MRAVARPLGLALSAALLALGVASCAAQKKRDALNQLQESIEAYNEAYRWKNYERAAAYVPADLRGAFLAAHEDEVSSLHVEDWQLLDVNVETPQAAKVTVRVRYMQLPSVIVEKKTVVQHWHEVNGAWILETEENPIRPLDPTKRPKNPEAAGDPTPDDHPADVEVTDPSGRVIREEGEGFGDDERGPE
ncbi:hypothetical protein L6R52_18685 [Myxococcota bacterium]|nr:hypothetical protein [Myxococcota bacterium]